jgi:CHAD domain-containing protein
MPGTPAPVLAEAARPEALGGALGALTGEVVEVARFSGREQPLAVAGEDGVQLTLLRGAVETGASKRAVARLRLAGPVGQVGRICTELAEALGKSIPHGGLAAEALGVTPAAPLAALGPPPIPARASVREFVAATLPGVIWLVLLETAAVTAAPSVEGIHRARVAVRRLRSVLGVLRRPLDCPSASGAAEALRPALRDLAACLGAARDWDVFLEGVGARLSERLGDHQDAARLIAAARRQRSAAYAALGASLARPGQRALERRLPLFAALRPWEEPGSPGAPVLAQAAAGFAAEVLDKRLHRLRRAGRRFEHLSIEALHALRKDGKRLRYAAEAFAPLFPRAKARRFLKRLRALQAVLGDLQDAEVARGLLAQLGSAGRGYAGGLAMGFAEGRRAALQADSHKAWRRFTKAEPFWT